MTQPTFSAGIKQLEDTLGVLLVQRGSRFHSFTPEGERVLEWARRIVGDARTMREEMRALKTGLAGHLRIAAVPTALAMVATLTTPYRARHPNLEIDAGVTYLDNEPLGRVRAIRLRSRRRPSAWSCPIASR